MNPQVAVDLAREAVLIATLIAAPVLIYLGVGTGRDSLSAPEGDEDTKP